MEIIKFPIRVKNFSNPESFEKSLEQNAAGMKLVLFAKLVIDGEGIFQVEGPSPEDVSRNCRKIIKEEKKVENKGNFDPNKIEKWKSLL